MNDVFIGFFEQLGLVIVVAAACALISRALKFPLLVGYIAAGIIIGGTAATSAVGHEVLKATSTIGLTLLLFLVGLEMNWNEARKQFKNAFSLGLIQIVTSLLLGWGISRFFNLSLISGLYLGIALSFASTVVVVKLLSEVRDTNTLHGRLAISVLLIQDLFAIIALMLLSGIAGKASGLPIHVELAWLSFKTVGVLLLAWSCNRLILPAAFKRIAHSTELLFLCSLAWCFLWVIGMKFLEVPMEIGALIAGVSLATLPYSLEIVSKIRVLRDFFVVLLFVGIGSEVHAPSAAALPLIISLIASVSVARPLISFITLAVSGYRVRTAFLTAVTQSQLSEFSIILIGIGVTSGQIDASLTGTIATTAAFSIIISTLLFNARARIYNLLKPVLRLFERGHHKHASLVLGERTDLEPLTGHVVLFGYHRMGYHILKAIAPLKKSVVVVDMNPDIVTNLRKEGITSIYGDLEDEEIFDASQVATADLVISTVPHIEETLFLLSQVKKRSRTAAIIVTAHSVDHALLYYKRHADFVLLPHMMAGKLVGELLSRSGVNVKAHGEAELKALKQQEHSLYFE
jgi:Kef-type K+ transport system membrane component KefB